MGSRIQATEPSVPHPLLSGLLCLKGACAALVLAHFGTSKHTTVTEVRKCSIVTRQGLHRCLPSSARVRVKFVQELGLHLSPGGDSA